MHMTMSSFNIEIYCNSWLLQRDCDSVWHYFDKCRCSLQKWRPENVLFAVCNW